MAETYTENMWLAAMANRHHDHGVADKDMIYAQTIDAGERTRDILASIASGLTTTEKVGAANQLATEKVGAAAVITAEKIGAAAVLATEKIGAANNLAVQLGFKDMALQMAECCCDIKKEIADVKATVLAVDANRIRDDLAQCRAELLARRTAS